MNNLIKKYILNISLSISLVLVFSSGLNAMDKDDPFIVKTTIHAKEYRVNANDYDKQTKILEADVAMGYDFNKVYFELNLEQAVTNNEEENEGDHTKEDKKEYSDNDLRGFGGANMHIYYEFVDYVYSNGLIGIKHDFRGDGTQFLSVGYKALMPYFIDTKTILFANNDGLVELDVGLEYEIMVTQNIVIMLANEFRFYNKNDETLKAYKGLGSIEGSVKLMYGISKKILPYISIGYEENYYKPDHIQALKNVNSEGGETFYAIGLQVWF
jgi:hypothetical protein